MELLLLSFLLLSLLKRWNCKFLLSTVAMEGE